MEVGQGNIMLFWGYFTTALSVVLFLLINFTHNFIWSWGWMLMFAVWPVISYRKRQKQTEGRYLYRQSDLTGMASDGIHVYHYFSDDRHYGNYIRQTCRFPAYATALPGLLRTRDFHYRHYNTGALDDLRPLIAFIVAIYMLTMLIMGEKATTLWYLFTSVYRSCL